MAKVQQHQCKNKNQQYHHMLAVFFRNFSGKNEFVFHALILGAIYVLAFSCRLISVLRFESIIHEFDPWFNFRSTKYLVNEGFYKFHNWFDHLSWYPLGRFIGGTIYPGLMFTAALVYHTLHFFHFTVDIRNVCVLLAPFMAGNTTIAVYLLTKEVSNGSAGILAAAFISIAPGYISRSIAGSYDNEAVAIFALIFCFYLWIKAIKTGSMMWGAMTALAYFYMVAAWGGYIFIINLIPFHVFALLLSGRYSHRIYVAYCTFYVIGTIMSMQILFVGFQPVTSPEHLAAFGIFCLLQVYNCFSWIKSLISAKHFEILLWWMFLLVVVLIGIIISLAFSGYVPFLTGRLKSLLGATTNIAIVKSVSEHQPSPWTTFFFELHMLVFLVPVGMYFCFETLTDSNLFIILYCLFSAYFASIMVRLVLVLAPACCILASIGLSSTLQTYMNVVVGTRNLDCEPDNKKAKTKSGEKKKEKSITTPDPRVTKPMALLVIGGILILCFFYVIHCIWVTSTAYSSPSIVLHAHHDGQRVVFDDFREAYAWLRHNTAEDAKIMSWWDYGYQITGMGNRTVIVDNNTRNNTHIATVGLAMASTEERAYEIMMSLDVNYALVVFGGKVGYSSDDINKFLWMVRISSGVYPEIIETDYFNSQGRYRVDKTASERMMNSLMYKMCYYNFGLLKTETDDEEHEGFDRVRSTEIGKKKFNLTYLEEAFTSEHWMVRIYRVKTDKTHPNFSRKVALEQQKQKYSQIL